MPDNLITKNQLKDSLARAKNSCDSSVSELAVAVTEAIEELERLIIEKQNRVLTWGDLLEDSEVVNVQEEGA